MMIVVSIIAIVAILALSWSYYVSKLYKMAKFLEESNSKEACYKYAYVVYVAHGSTALEKDAPKRIKHLWEKFGPFDYSDHASSIKSQSELEFHKGLVRLIEGIIK